MKKEGSAISAPVPGEAAVTAAAMRAAAGLIEEAGIGRLLVSCRGDHVIIHVSQHDGDAAVRSGLVAALAGLLGASPFQRDSRSSPEAWLEAAGQVRGVPVEVFTALDARPAPGGAGALAARPGGHVTVIGAGQQLPPGWRWVTDLDDEHAASAAGQTVP